jgi:hypothetical protein
MPIPMQGSWTVSVKTKEAGSSPSRFIVAGATTGNGTYVGNTTTPPVHVTGAAWSIDFQHNPASGFVESFFEIGFPTNNGTHYAFDINISDFPASVDSGFDDLILTCTTPVTQNDFIVFGNVSWYADCIFTRCHPFPSVVIDSAVALQAALQRPALRKVIQSLHPERLYPKPVGPQPDPGPFRPFLLPVGDNPIVPAQQVSVFADITCHTDVAAATRASQLVTVNVPSVSPAVSLSALDAASLIIPNRFCQSGALAQYVLDFWDYTPTASEAAGGPYTGAGARTLLGVTTTDILGNYVFRFTLPCERFRAFSALQLQQIKIPFPHCIVPLPNVIVQVLDGATLVYETAPYWNEPHYAEFNICVPKGVVTTSPACSVLVDGQTQSQEIIQSIGNITMGPLLAGTRTTGNTTLTAQGTVTNSGSLGPTISCPAAWAGSLYFYACLSNTAIVRYTIQFGRTLATADNFVHEDYSPYRTIPVSPYVIQQSVGPTTVALETDHAGHPGVLNPVPSYFNAQTNTTTPWLVRWTILKMVLTSSIYQQALGGPDLGAGSIVFRIQGYDSTGHQVPGADDNITLYIDNNFVDQFLDPNLVMLITGAPQSQSNCALFTVPSGQPNAPIQVSFRSNQNEGFMTNYELYMDKGSTGSFPIAPVVGTPPIDVSQCDFTGTSAESGYGAAVANELTAQVIPTTGNWLAPGQPFCAFSINLRCYVSVTDGQGVFGPFYSGPLLIGIQQGP